MIDRIIRYFGKILAALTGLLVGIIVLIAFSPAWAGIGLLGLQILLWLNTGAWSSFRLTDGIDLIAADLGFVNELKDLSGLGESLWNLVNLIPMSAFLIIVGLLLSGAVASIYDGLRDKLKEGMEEPSESDVAPIHVPSAATSPLILYTIQGEDWDRTPRSNEPSPIPLVENQESQT
jgi:hypothetical protein